MCFTSFCSRGFYFSFAIVACLLYSEVWFENKNCLDCGDIVLPV